jgi:murein DD-endopeptidase MepM/ murein hydrolase activator NlpD
MRKNKPFVLLLSLLSVLCAWSQDIVQYDYANSDPFGGGNSFTIDFRELPDSEWHYPLPGGKVISSYHAKGRSGHSGTDIKTKPNDSIYAAFAGIVTMSKPFAGYGNCITIRHASGLTTLYSHNSKNFVVEGDYVEAGQVIALTGRTGRATTEHLHFEVRTGRTTHNPNVIFDLEKRTLRRQKLTFYKNGKVVSR